MKEKNKNAVKLGKLSVEARKKKGHNAEYYRKLAQKRWKKPCE